MAKCCKEISESLGSHLVIALSISAISEVFHLLVNVVSATLADGRFPQSIRLVETANDVLNDIRRNAPFRYNNPYHQFSPDLRQASSHLQANIARADAAVAGEPILPLNGACRGAKPQLRFRIAAIFAMRSCWSPRHVFLKIFSRSQLIQDAMFFDALVRLMHHAWEK